MLAVHIKLNMAQDNPHSHPNPLSENQENLILKNVLNFNEENFILNLKNGEKVSVMTPSGGAKNVLTNRKVLAEKTPSNGNIK